MSTHRFILEPYKGVSTRHTCPNCHRKRCFSKYIDTEKRIQFPDYVGRCDHEQKCGYHFTPRDYFERNPAEKELWTQEVPQTMYHARKELLVSVLIFLASVLVGIVSAANDDNFVRLILGNGYVDMTLDNIARGEPMAVYNGSEEVPMFLGITLNNIMVSFNVFAMGLLTSFGTGWLLFNNGVMLGAFQTFFFKHGLLGESMLAIWLHGTLEIWAIIVAGAAGLALGNGWLFPGTYSRKESFMRGAKKGLKIIVGTVPIFIMAGFIEGFITRHTELPDVLRLGIILLSLSFIIYYYIYLPNRKTHGITKT